MPIADSSTGSSSSSSQRSNEGFNTCSLNTKTRTRARAMKFQTETKIKSMTSMTEERTCEPSLDSKQNSSLDYSNALQWLCRGYVRVGMRTNRRGYGLAGHNIP